MISTKKIVFATIGLAILAEIFLVYIIYFNKNTIEPMLDPDLHVWINCLFNFLSASMLFLAYRAISKKNIKLHIIYIHAALFFSFCFLINYIFYHLGVGHTKFVNSDFRMLYLVILATHLITSLVSLPCIFLSYSFGVFNKMAEHKKFAKITFLLWEYVSISGIIVVMFLKFVHQG